MVEDMDLPLSRPEQLPPLGTSRERLAMDFKREVNPAKHFEMAKDVAAFANSAGGVILVGAEEEENRLARYSPMAEARADLVRAAYSQAVTTRCSPVPICEAAVVLIPGGALVAVSVWAFPAQAVGVRLNGDKAVEGHGGPGWVFPLRTAVDTVLIRPEQLPMLMLPELRRIAILLEMIPFSRRRDIEVHQLLQRLENGRWAEQMTSLDFVEVRLLENVAVFRGSAGVLPESLCHIPLEAIQSAWSTVNGTWRITVRGMIEAHNASGLVFDPRY